MKASKAFTSCTVPVQGRQMRGFMVQCGHCGVTGAVPVNTFKHGDDEGEARSIRTKLQAKGWLIGKNQGQHRCPGCYSKIKFAQVNKSKEAKLPETKLSVVPEMPRQMTREDRRIIFEKLNEVYADEKTGYGDNWTDAKVGSDLGVPKAWVATIRDENFGPEGSNDQIRATIAEAKELLGEVKRVGSSAETIVGSLRTLLARAEKIEKTVSDIQKAVS